jgi:hypothetical protein
MRLIFTKRDGKYDDLTVEREGRASAKIACPKQGIIPHDMVHFAVESVLSHRGFLSLLEEAETPGYRLRGEAGEEAVERLVECFQAEMWGGRVSAAELLDSYALACEAKSHEAVRVSQDDVVAIRGCLDELTERWEQVPINASLVCELSCAARPVDGQRS